MKKVILAAVVAVAFLAASCGGSNKATTTITKGSLSKFDTLSYAVGINLASVTKNQLGDLPLNFDVLVKELVSAADGSSKLSHEDATATLQDYFMTKRQARAEEVNRSRDEADSIALANGADKAVVAITRQGLPADASMFENEAERSSVSQALGNDLGSSIAAAKVAAQTVWIEQAFKDMIAEDLKITEEQANAEIQKFFTVTLPAQNLEASQEWLSSIEGKSGVQKTESGLLYKVEVKGDDSVIATDDRDVVKVKYTGKTRNGDVFDSSRYADMEQERLDYLRGHSENGELTEEGEIIEFPLNRVIPGWTEGMKLVGKGGRISLWIPSDLAYGTRGAGANIGANEALYFDVEVVDVVPFEEPVATEE